MERASDIKHEYWYGEVFAMAGGSPAHSLIINNIQIALTVRLAGTTCFGFNADLRVGVRSGDIITYPDMTVLCDRPQYFDDRKDVLINPTLVVEVLSPSTKKTDRGEKATAYREVPSMREILLVDQAPLFIEHYRKLPNGHWNIETISDSAAEIHIDIVNRNIPVSEFYLNLDRL
jgi:Uma2 family endonuclease